MTVDQQLRDRFDRATEGVLPSPDLARAIATGRRRRRVVPIASCAAGVAAFGVLATALVAGPWPDPGDVSVAEAPDGTSYVAGTYVDEQLAAVVAAAAPELPAPTDVFPMEWRTAGNPPGQHAPSAGSRIPDEHFADATAWQLRYELAPDHVVQVTVAIPVDGQWPAYACDADGLLSFGPEPDAEMRLAPPSGAAVGGPVPSCAYQYSPDDPLAPAYLWQSVGSGPRVDVAVAVTERVGEGTEAEGRERAAFVGDETVEFVSGLDFDRVLAP